MADGGRRSSYKYRRKRSLAQDSGRERDSRHSRHRVERVIRQVKGEREEGCSRKC